MAQGGIVEWLSVTLALYRRTLARAAPLALQNWPVLGSVFVYGAVLTLAARFAVVLGLAGGFLISLVTAACFGSFLYLVEMMVQTSRVTWEDFRRSFGMYLWDVVGVSFTLWLFWQIAMPLLLQMPQGAVIAVFVNILILVLFNAVPELIYLGHHSLLSLLSESYRFVADNWIEWFPPNVVFLLVLVTLWSLPVAGVVAALAQTAAAALFVYFAMVMRGLLFIELSGSTRRARAFRHRMGQ
jgi:hypothetical protein